MTNLAPSPLEGEGRGEGKAGILSSVSRPQRHAGDNGNQILRFAQNDRGETEGQRGENDRWRAGMTSEEAA